MKKFLNTLFARTLGLYFNLGAYIAPNKIAEKAFILFCTPRKGKVLKGQRGFLEDAKDLLLEHGHTKIQTYRWKGSGATVLLMHGWESNSFRWRNLIPRLQKEDFNIVALDAPGHGNTSGKLLNLPLYSACAQKVIETYAPQYVIGHSLGGMAILYNAHTYSEDNQKIEKIVTLGAPSELTDFMKQYKRILGLSKRTMGLIEDYFVTVFGFRFVDFSSPKFAENIDQDGLLIHDELDAIAPFWSSQQVHDRWKGSTLISTRGLGHSMHQDKVREHIVAFLKS